MLRQLVYPVLMPGLKRKVRIIESDFRSGIQGNEIKILVSPFDDSSVLKKWSFIILHLHPRSMINKDNGFSLINCSATKE
jgi:hypothetical protein